MRERNFIVSIKTVDDKALFPSNFNGEVFLMMLTTQVSAKTGIALKGFASFPTGVEFILYCKDVQEARSYADDVANNIYLKTNSLCHVIYSFGIYVSELTDDEKTLEAVMMDMMTRSMAARGFDMGSVTDMCVS